MSRKCKHKFPLDEEGKVKISFGEYMIGQFELVGGLIVCTSATTLSGETLICSTYDGEDPSTKIFEFDIITVALEWDADERAITVRSCVDSENYSLMDTISSV